MSISLNTEMPCMLSLYRSVGKKQRRSLSLRLIALRIGPEIDCSDRIVTLSLNDQAQTWELLSLT